MSAADASRRDRDAAGRARNARPRDELGRPLPYGAQGVPAIPDDLSLTAEQTLVEAQRLLDAGRAFQAHEVLESTWKATSGPERELWRGLAQLAVGVTHAQRGNAVGAVALLGRAVDRLEGHGGEVPHDVDVAGLVAWARTVIERLQRSGPAALTHADLAPRLTRSPH